MITKAHRKSRLSFQFSSPRIVLLCGIPLGAAEDSFLSVSSSIKQCSDPLFSGNVGNVILDKCFFPIRITHFTHRMDMMIIYFRKLAPRPIDVIFLSLCTTYVLVACWKQGTMTHLTIWVIPPPLTRPLQLTCNTAWALSNHRIPLF